MTRPSAAGPFEILAERIQQGAAMLSAQGDIVFVNEKLSASMLKIPADEMLGARLERFVAEADRNALAACLTAGRKGSAQCEAHLAASDGTAVSVLVSVSSLGADEVICLFSDISLQKRHATADERTRKFLATLAHEFRGMLATIGYSVAYLKAAAPLDPKAREAVDTIERQTQRLTALVEDLRKVNPKD